MLNDFFEFKTKKNEPIIISLDRIAFITSYKGKAVLFDLDGQEFDSNEDFETFKTRLIQCVKFKF